MKRFFATLLVFLFPASLLFSGELKNGGDESGSYKISLSHGRKINSSTFEFDVFIEGSGKKFVLENYQCAFNIGSSLPANTMQFDYIASSSDLKNFPEVSAVVSDEQGNTILVFASHPSGSDTIPESETRIGKFKVRTVNPKGDSLLSLSWNFKGDLNTIICSSLKNITNPANHIGFDGKTSEENLETLLPKVYALSQNFPNPFNPSTSIRFSLPFDSKIKISIYNALGELVTNLADKIEQAGNHEISWNASGMSSGLYIYAIEAEPVKGGSSFKSVKKMMLLK